MYRKLISEIQFEILIPSFTPNLCETMTLSFKHSSFVWCRMDVFFDYIDYDFYSLGSLVNPFLLHLF